METGYDEAITLRSLTCGNLAMRQSLEDFWEGFADAVSGELRLVRPELDD